MPNRSIEIHDSVLSAVLFLPHEAQLHFSSVYIHKSEGKPGLDAGTGWVQKAILRIHYATVEGAFSQFPVDLNGGNIQIGKNILDNEIPVPFQYQGTFRLSLKAMWQEEEIVIFTGSGAELELLGDPEYVEGFRP